MNLDIIFNSLGPNKVTQPLFINDFEETLYNYQSGNQTKKVFINMLDPLNILRNKRSTSSSYLEQVVLDEKPRKLGTKQISSVPLGGVMSVWIIFMELEDKTFSLYDNKTQYTKVIQYKDKLIRDFRLNLPDKIIKKFKISEESLHHDIDTIFTYMATKFNKSIYDIYHKKLYGNDMKQNVIIIDYDSIKNVYMLSSKSATINEIYKEMCSDIDKKLVKDLRSIASFMGISSSKLVDGKKKVLLKDELLTEITKFLNTNS